ncbi:MAG: ribonuclease HI family protein [bacterium]|nr:ribonuclease HI family protein [bacterium]
MSTSSTTKTNPHLLVFSDGGSRGNPGPAGCGAVICDKKGKVLKKLKKYIGIATNNVAEYEGLLLGLKEAAKMKGEQITCYADSLLVMEHMSGRWKVKHEGLKPLHKKATTLTKKFSKISFHHIPRERNTLADELANQAMDAKR